MGRRKGSKNKNGLTAGTKYWRAEFGLEKVSKTDLRKRRSRAKAVAEAEGSGFGKGWVDLDRSMAVLEAFRQGGAETQNDFDAFCEQWRINEMKRLLARSDEARELRKQWRAQNKK